MFFIHMTFIWLFSKPANFRPRRKKSVFRPICQSLFAKVSEAATNLVIVDIPQKSIRLRPKSQSIFFSKAASVTMSYPKRHYYEQRCITLLNDWLRIYQVTPVKWVIIIINRSLLCKAWRERKHSISPNTTTTHNQPMEGRKR